MGQPEEPQDPTPHPSRAPEDPTPHPSRAPEDPAPWRAPLSQRACEAICLGFALWTLCSHGVVAAGGSLPWLVALYAAAGAAVLFVSRRLARPAPRAPDPPGLREPEGIGLPTWLPRAALAAGSAAAVVAVLRDDPILTWVLLALLLLAAAVPFLWMEAPRWEAPQRSRSTETILLAIGVACALYALVVHRPDADDSFYVDMAVSAVDLPSLPLLARDTLHGRFDLPIHYSAYRLHSWELWNGAISLLTGIPAVYVFQLISAALAALLVPLCHAVLFRLLTPRYWIATTLAFVVVLAAPGETHRWYGNFAFVRMWQGKAVCLFVFMPLVYAFAIRFAQRGDRASWLRLAAAQIAALGCTSTAVWSAPAGAWLAMGCVLRPSREGLRRFALGALASAYVLAAGLLVKGGMTASIPEISEVFAPGVQLAGALHTALGDGRLYVVGLASLFVAFAVVPAGLARRFAIALPLGVTLVLFDPWADAWVRANVTGPSFWRTTWALPVPILLALIAVAPLSLRDHAVGWARRFGLSAAAGRHLAGASCAALLLGFALWVPRFPGWSERNEGAWLGWPSLKVGPGQPFAHVLNQLAPGRRVVAPPSVSAWVPIEPHHAYPLVVRVYLRPQRERIGKIAYRDRVIMTRFTDGNDDYPHAAAIFERGLDLYDVQAVCIRNSKLIDETRDILRRTGFVKRLQSPDMEIWARAR